MAGNAGISPCLSLLLLSLLSQSRAAQRRRSSRKTFLLLLVLLVLLVLPLCSPLSLPPLPPNSQLAQLSTLTTLSIDSGDLSAVAAYASLRHPETKKPLITDATTNPLFVAQAALSGDAEYEEMVSSACASAGSVEGAMDGLAVQLGARLSRLVPGYVSTEVDPRLSFSAAKTVERALAILSMYESLSVPRSRVLIKIAATWEGVQAARALQERGVSCNLTLVFGRAQAAACAQAGATLISPFPGRILDYHNARAQREHPQPADDEGVLAVRGMHRYNAANGHGTIVMPASWRPSRGPGGAASGDRWGAWDLDEIRELAGADRMTVPPALLLRLLEATEELPRKLGGGVKDDAPDAPVVDYVNDEEAFRSAVNLDGCTTVKLQEGLAAFIRETEKLEAVITEKMA
jgi:transaldolase